MVDVSGNLRELKDEVEKLCKRFSRTDEVVILAATKSASAEMIEQASESGVCIIGENRVQEAKRKFSSMNNNVRKHFIGHLQTNKVRDVVKMFDCIESVDSERLLNLINDEAARVSKVIDVYIEVNISGEESKFGVSRDEVVDLVRKGDELDDVSIVGLMTILPHGIRVSEKEEFFMKMKNLFDEIKEEYRFVKVLSMGMSEDYKIAVKCGSTEIRIGSLLFQDH